MSMQPESHNVTCKNCGASISPEQKYCPSCGAAIGEAIKAVESTPSPKPKKKGRNIILIVLGIFVVVCVCLIGVVAIFGGNGESDTIAQPQTISTDSPSDDIAEVEQLPQELTPTEQPKPTEQPEPTETPIPTEQVFTIGQDVIVGEVRWKMLSAVNEGNTLQSGNQFIDDVTTAGTFIRVRFEVENLSKDLLSYTSIDLVDDQGREFVNSSNVFAFIDDKELCFLIVNLNPNVPVTCQEIFEVPTNATGLQAKVGDLKLFGTKEALIDLGLE